jgi:hypothetical protein
LVFQFFVQKSLAGPFPELFGGIAFEDFAANVFGEGSLTVIAPERP